MGKIYLCRGCTVLYSTVLIFFLIFLILNPLNDFSYEIKFFLVVCITLPTWFTLFYTTNRRFIKDISRFALGVGIAISLSEIWYAESIIIRAMIISFVGVTYFLFKKIYTAFRQNKVTNLCENCKSSKNSACLSFINQISSKNQFDKFISDYLQAYLSWEDIKQIILENPSLKED